MTGDDVERVHVTMLRYTHGAQREKTAGGKPCLPLMIGDLVRDERRTGVICDRIKAMYDDGRYVIVLSHQRAHLDAISHALQTRGVRADDLQLLTGAFFF